MIVLENILSQEIVQKLGWTLLHFIWQATAVALLLAILLRLLRKSTASLRYIIACLALGLIVLLPVITIQLVPVSTPHPTAHIEPAPAPAVSPTAEIPVTETVVLDEPVQPEIAAPVSTESWKQRTVESLESALPYIVSGWLVGVFALSLWHLGGWAQLQRLRRKMVKQVDGTLHSKLKVLAQRLRVNQTVQLVESALVQIPTVVGWLKPVILLPASALTSLSSEQLEAILAHELAHIKRYDYLINILQTVVEILGFYHPAVWWISHKIRAERENCCDDLAVAISGDRVCYAGALTSMEEIRAGQGQLVRSGGLAVTASGGNLFRRIRRLLSKDSAQKTNFSWIPAATAILLIMALVIPTTLAFTTQSDSKIDVHVENDRSGESQQEKEPSVDDIPTVLPTIAKSPTPSAEDKTHVQVDCLIVEVSLDSKMDRETVIEAENLLGNKISLRDTKVDVLLRKAAGATAATKDKSAENKRVTQDQFKALTEMLTSRGYIKILMNPTLQVIDGKTAKILSTQGSIEDSIQITPHVFADGHITLEVKAAINSKSIPKGVEQIPIVTTRELTTRVRISPGESLIIGGLTEKDPAPGDNVKNSKKRTAELLLILTPTIITPATDSQEKTDMPVKVKPDKTSGKLAANRAFFTPPIARIINSAVERKDCFIDFDNDKLYSPPSDFHSLAREQQEAWKRENSIDACATVSEGAEGLWGEEMVIIPLADVEFDRMTPASFRDFLKQATPGTPAVMTAIGQLPKTYLFKTREGGMGLLQILEIQRKRSPHYIKIRYKMVPRTVEADVKITSNKNLQDLGKALLIYANDHEDKYPDSLHRLTDYLNVEELTWILANIEYLAHGKQLASRPDTIIAYDKKLLAKGKGTNVLYNDFHVGFEKVEKLKKLGISETEILIETTILSVSEDFLQSIGLDANSIHDANAWSKLTPGVLAASDDPNILGLILDDLNVNFFLGTVRRSHKGARVLAAPQILCQESKTAEVKILQNESYYVSSYTEPNRPSGKPEPKVDSVKPGTRFWVTPKLTPDNENIELDFELEIRRLLGFEERKYKGKYPYKIPKVNVVSTKARYLVPDSKTLLIGGQKFTDEEDGQKVQKRLIVLIKAKILDSKTKGY